MTDTYDNYWTIYISDDNYSQEEAEHIVKNEDGLEAIAHILGATSETLALFPHFGDYWDDDEYCYVRYNSLDYKVVKSGIDIRGDPFLDIAHDEDTLVNFTASPTKGYELPDGCLIDDVLCPVGCVMKTPYHPNTARQEDWAEFLH